MSDSPTRSISPGDEPPPRRTVAAAWLERPGDEIGPYKLVSILGEGGFGTVWLAERRKPFHQRVALKIIKPGMDSKAVLARFEQERQALALMDHPNVAKVLDGGMTAGGRPYFAMELVKGEPINDFCDKRRLPISARLRLFVQVCEAVQHAHTKGIIHRDLKPSNVLVSVGDGDEATAKVIDFGVAKALVSKLSEHTVFTETGQMIGTPEYMSPEQAEPDANDIDTRSDVYSLGVILYELLSGTLPFDSRDLRSRAYREVQRIIREVDPPAPSTRLSTVATRDAAEATAIAERRRERTASLATLLRRELEWIPLKAMRKDRRERYGSPSDLARDIENYLGGRPLVAAPESRLYLAAKFGRRHQGGIIAALIVLSALMTAASAIMKRIADERMYAAMMERTEVEARRREAEVAAGADFIRLLVVQPVETPRSTLLVGSSSGSSKVLRSCMQAAGQAEIGSVDDALALIEPLIEENRRMLVELRDAAKQRPSPEQVHAMAALTTERVALFYTRSSVLRRAQRFAEAIEPAYLALLWGRRIGMGQPGDRRVREFAAEIDRMAESIGRPSSLLASLEVKEYPDIDPPIHEIAGHELLGAAPGGGMLTLDGEGALWGVSASDASRRALPWKDPSLRAARGISVAGGLLAYLLPTDASEQRGRLVVRRLESGEVLHEREAVASVLAIDELAPRVILVPVRSSVEEPPQKATVIDLSAAGQPVEREFVLPLRAWVGQDRRSDIRLRGELLLLPNGSIDGSADAFIIPLDGGPPMGIGLSQCMRVATTESVSRAVFADNYGAVRIVELPSGARRDLSTVRLDFWGDAVWMSPDGGTIAVATASQAMVVDAADDKVLRWVDLLRVGAMGSGTVKALFVDRAAQVLAIETDGRIGLWPIAAPSSGLPVDWTRVRGEWMLMGGD